MSTFDLKKSMNHKARFYDCEKTQQFGLIKCEFHGGSKEKLEMEV